MKGNIMQLEKGQRWFNRANNIVQVIGHGMEGYTVEIEGSGYKYVVNSDGIALHDEKDHGDLTVQVPAPGPVVMIEPAEEESGGGKLKGDHYYRVEVKAPISPEVAPYVAECADIIEALDMTFNEGEAFKALWRLAASRQGRGKPGNKPEYDADKAAHYGVRTAVHTRRMLDGQ